MLHTFLYYAWARRIDVCSKQKLHKLCFTNLLEETEKVDLTYPVSVLMLSAEVVKVSYA